MKSLKFSQDIVPIGEFKSNAAAWLQKLNARRRPMLITQNGKPAGILLSPAEFDEFIERERFLESVAKGIQDANEGRVMSTAALRKRLERKEPARRAA